jgi:hypothetical protein
MKCKALERFCSHLKVGWLEIVYGLESQFWEFALLLEGRAEKIWVELWALEMIDETHGYLFLFFAMLKAAKVKSSVSLSEKAQPMTLRDNTL